MINPESIKWPTHLPWFMFDLRNFILITTETIPSDIQDIKEVALSETAVPGLNYSPITYGGGGNRKLSFTIPIVKRNNLTGNTLQIAQFENLRQQGTITKAWSRVAGNDLGFQPSPKVLFYYGVGFPSVWFVKKCDFVHKQGWINAIGNPQYTDVSIELWYDETDPVNEVELLYRKVAAYAGVVESAYNLIARTTGDKNYKPY